MDSRLFNNDNKNSSDNWIVISDLMTGFSAIIIIIAIFSTLLIGKNLLSIKQKFDNLEHNYDTLKSDYYNLKDKYNYSLKHRQRQISLLNLEEKTFYELGDYHLKTDNPYVVKKLNKFAVTIKEEILKRTSVYNYNFKIAIQGHTDIVPVLKTATYRNNWELGALRAAELLNYLFSKTILKDNKIFLQYFIIESFSYTEPLNPDNLKSPENRRVEVKIYENYKIPEF